MFTRSNLCQNNQVSLQIRRTPPLLSVHKKCALDAASTQMFTKIFFYFILTLSLHPNMLTSKSESKVHPRQTIENVQEKKVKQKAPYGFKKPYAIATWIKENINKKECCYFQRDARDDVCKCGYLKDEHSVGAIKPEELTGETWDRHRHIHEVPTDAFGDVSFDGLRRTISKYARVSTDTSPEDLYHLLTEQWKLSPPNLLISVSGGAKNFNLKTRLKNIFHRGLIKMAQNTGAWIITGGTHAGVMKHVGQAVKDYALSSAMQGNKLVVIGVATWGVIHNGEDLVHKDGRFPAHYVMDTKGQGQLSCLDNNHTHFLLVDDGTHGHYGVEIELRTRLEKCISRKHLANKDSRVTIPVVCVVLNGGPGTLNTIYNAMLNGTPCVVFEGSGRIADVIAHVSGFPVSLVTIALIHQLMKKCFGQEYESFSELKIIEWTKKVQDIIRMSHLLTIFRVNEDTYGDVEVAILQALLKASRGSESRGTESWKRQLELAITWNRVDIAKTEIFTEESQWKSSDLHWAMFSALVSNRPQFVSLLQENGVSLRDFLQDEETLCALYNQLPSCFFLCKLAKRVKSAGRSKKKGLALRARGNARQGERICLTHVSDEVHHLLGRFTKPIYPPSTMMYQLDMFIKDMPVSQCQDQAASQTPLKEDKPETQRDAARDLFLWTIVQNNKELAEIAWEQCTDCMSAALAASKILKKMAEEGRDADEAQEMLELADYYEKHAIGVFSECYDSDEERAQKLLVRVSHFWGKTTCLRLALEADNKNFVAQSGIQALLTQIWCGELSVDNRVWRVLICMVFFPLIYTGFLVFRRDELIQRETEKREEMRTLETVTGSSYWANHIMPAPQVKPLSCWSKLASLYSSPQVKFYWNIASYFAFLFLFAAVLLVDFQSSPSGSELLLYIWLLSLVCEEIRQLFYDPDGFCFYKKVTKYIKDFWNILDVLSILLFSVGLAFRLTPELLYAGKILLCIDFVVFCLRLMAIFTISRTLGPKIIIVRKMMMDMFFFLFLLSIWVVAYGVAKQGILIDNDDRLDWIVRGAVYEPYLIIFGNFPTNIDYTEFDITTCNMNGTDPLKPKCPRLNENHTPAFPEWLTIIMLCVYLLFANILLLNLLIAIFNFTFQEVQDNTDKIWKFQRYELIKEYHSRPAVPPPFMILSHLCYFIKSVVLRSSPTSHKDFKHELPQMEEEELLSWEALMKDRYLLSSQQELSQSMEGRILDTAQKVTTMTEQLEKEKEMSSAAVLKKLTELEEQVVQSSKALQWIMDTLMSQGAPAEESQSHTFTRADEPAGSLKNTSEKESSFHVKARQFHYPNCKVTRFAVPEEKVPWEVSFSSYNPTYYDFENKNRSPETLHGYRNPQGRTGIVGRGCLSRLGPNPNLDLVLTRWRDSERLVLEYLAVWDEHQGCLTLPGGPIDSADHLPVALKSTLGNKLYEALNIKLSEGTKVCEGYADDCRNTDNAWVETTIVNIHLDRASQETVDIDNMVKSSHGCLLWQEVSGQTRLGSNQRDSLQLVAALHNTSV